MTGNQWALIYLAVGVALQAYKWYKKESDIVCITNQMRMVVSTPIATIVVLAVILLMVILWPYVAVNTTIHHIKQKRPPSQ